MNSDKYAVSAIGRREFLLGLSAAAAGSPLVRAETGQTKHKTSPAPLLPTINLGEHKITRLIVGSNPISGYSYMGPIMDEHMKEYFTPKHQGINTHQFSHPEKMINIFRELRETGSKMKLICLHAGGPERMPIDKVVKDTKPIAIAHHGGVTDRLFGEGKSRQVHDFVKRVHDAGVLAGVSAHNPDCIKRIADEGWPVDFFMTCFYYLTRTQEELEKMPPVVTPQIGYSFFASDPIAMTKVVRQVELPCLGFKILAAGRMCGKANKVEAAFKFAFKNLKPTDGVIVGMYPRYHDQINQNAEHTRKFASTGNT
jgi:hypothetical protein